MMTSHRLERGTDFCFCLMMILFVLRLCQLTCIELLGKLSLSDERLDEPFDKLKSSDELSSELCEDQENRSFSFSLMSSDFSSPHKDHEPRVVRRPKLLCARRLAFSPYSCED